VVAIFGVQGWRWDWVREVRELVFALDADATGQQQWRQLARQAALREKRVAGLPPEAYEGYKDASAAWAAGVLSIHAWQGTGACYLRGVRCLRIAERRGAPVAIMVADSGLPHAEAVRLAWESLSPARSDTHGGRDGEPGQSPPRW
jgi:hypothetical protein